MRDRLIADGETALRRWGSVRMLMICVPMVLDLLLYYLFGAVVGFFYMAVIHLLTITFVFPTKRRCEHECRAEEQPAEGPMQDDSSHQGQP